MVVVTLTAVVQSTILAAVHGGDYNNLGASEANFHDDCGGSFFIPVDRNVGLTTVVGAVVWIVVVG